MTIPKKTAPAKSLQSKKGFTLGALALRLVLEEDEALERLIREGSAAGYKICKGRVGAMDSAKIFAAVETAAKKEGFIGESYRQEHGVYHSVLEAYQGLCRGQEGLGTMLRSAGLVFSLVAGPRIEGDSTDGTWVAVVLFGSVGAPIVGFEHEAVGLGIHPL